MAQVVCQTENCVNGPGVHPFKMDVERPIDEQPDRCQPREWVGRVRPLRDDPIETNEDGGSQSVIELTFTTMPLTALSMLSQLQKLGDAKYGAHNWRSIPEHDHINHAFAHLLGHCTGDRTEDHLLHAAWRLVAALEVRATRSTHYEENPDD